ncbi:MAG: alpha/beta hydrolase [Myxococcales bacterium]|nr:alpha/beta hydrolase [Myxococcales bacterium]
MPMFERGDVRLHYTELGDPTGPAVLLIAPGGLRSAAERWEAAPYDPRAQLADSGLRLIAMDQRNAGDSWAPITIADGWETYTADQLALLDHLGVKQFSVVGMCIGGPYALNLMRRAAERVRCAVLLQPIGLHGNRHAFEGLFDGWSASVASEHPEASAGSWAAFRHRMFGGDFVFALGREDVAAITAPVLLLKGDDLYHPAETSVALSRLLRNVTFLEEWKTGGALDEASRQIGAFLAEHATE